MDTGIEVQLWNVLKYVLLTLLLAPVAESAMSRITAWRHAQLVHAGNPIRLKSSSLGNIALHQEVETLHASSRLWLLFSVVLALGIALPFEYSSGAQSRIIWSQQRSRSSSVATNGSNDLMLLALDKPRQSECVDPDRLADVGEFVFLQAMTNKPALLDGIVTSQVINDRLIFDPEHNWTRATLHSRSGDVGLCLFAGGRGGQQAVIVDPERRGLLVADFESGSLCKGLIDEVFSCYDMAGQLALSQLAYSLAAIRGGSMFLRTQFENEATLYRFKAGLIFNSIGDPSVEQNMYEQRLNESGYQWLWRHEHEGESTSVSISTLRLDEQLRLTNCEAPGAVQIRPLGLRVGESLISEELKVNVSTKGELRLVKGGDRLRTVVLTNVGGDWECAIDDSWGLCAKLSNGTLYSLRKTEGVYEYRSEFKLPLTQHMENKADLAVLLSQRWSDSIRSGRQAVWDMQNLLSPSGTPKEGARTITRGMDLSVAVSSGTRVTGTIEIWAVVLYGCLLLFFSLMVILFKIKSMASVTVEEMYRRVVWQKDLIFNGSETQFMPNTAPTIGVDPTEEIGEVTASYCSIRNIPVD